MRLLRFTYVLVWVMLVTQLAFAQIETIPTSQIEPGMKGYGLTVFQGTTPERFGVEVVDVVPNFMIKQDIILIRCAHPVTDKAGVIGGMSGSPIFIEGKLAGALAYGWRFNKEPLAGVTPIQNMMELQQIPARGYTTTQSADSLNALLKNPLSFFTTREENTFYNQYKDSSSASLIPATMPLSISGFSGEGHHILEESLAPFGFIPMQGGGTGESTGGPTSFENGSAIGVQLIRGDLSATGIGTVTLVDGNDVLAFGHPMLNLGENHLPVTTAKIHTVIASVARSNKLGSPLTEAGSLIQDRLPGIMARTDMRAPMVPVHFEIEDLNSNRTHHFNIEVANRRLMMGRLITAATVQFIQHAAADAADISATVTSRIKLKGRPVITISDAGVSRRGLATVFTFLKPIALLHAILNNPFENVEIESVTYKVKLSYGLNYTRIMGAYLTSERPMPGDTVNVNVRLLNYGGKERIITVPFTIPSGFTNEKLRITVGGGSFVYPQLAYPENLEQLLTEISKLYSARSIVLQVDSPHKTVSIRGQIISDLPQGAAQTLMPKTGAGNEQTYKTEYTQVVPMDQYIAGHETITVETGRQTKK